MGEFNDTGYSANVRIWLEYRGQKIPLSQASSTFVIAVEPIDLPANSPASIVFTVDDEKHQRDVTLVNGMTRDNREAMVISRDHIPF